MKYAILLLIFLVACSSSQVIEQEQTKEVSLMKLTSNSFENEKDIPTVYTCQGKDINPHLAWSEISMEAKSLALIMDDPDAPNGLWTHWLIKDIPIDVFTIQEDSTLGVEIRNSFRKSAYGGPCPPSGKHRYFFKLYALDVEKLEANNLDEFYEQVELHKIDEAVLMGLYEKN